MIRTDQHTGNLFVIGEDELSCVLTTTSQGPLGDVEQVSLQSHCSEYLW